MPIPEDFLLADRQYQITIELQRGHGRSADRREADDL
jgi:hypothetical protein